jgi:hypothetical protein
MTEGALDAADVVAEQHRFEIPRLKTESVRLQLWGLTEAELELARQNVSSHPSFHSWHIADTQGQVGGPSPIRANDHSALGHRAWYGWAWAAYRVTVTKSA